MKKSQLKQLIFEVVKQEQVGQIKNISIESKIKQAEGLLKIIEDQGSTYQSLADEAEKLYQAKEYPELKAEAKRLQEMADAKEVVYKKLEAKIKSLQSQLGGGADKKKVAPKEKINEENKTFNNHEDNSIPIIAVDNNGKETQFDSRSQAARKLFIRDDKIHAFFRSKKRTPVASYKFPEKQYTFKQVSDKVKKEGKLGNLAMGLAATAATALGSCDTCKHTSTYSSNSHNKMTYGHSDEPGMKATKNPYAVKAKKPAKSHNRYSTKGWRSW